MKKHITSILFAGLALAALSTPLSAVSCDGTVNEVPAAAASRLSYIRDTISEWGACRTAALTTSGIGIAVVDDNVCAVTQAPESLVKTLRSIYDAEERISDLHVTEQGKWVVITGRNGWSADGAPEAMIADLRRANETDALIRSACFDDSGRYVIVTNKTVFHNLGDTFVNLRSKAEESWGELLSVSFSAQGMTLCCASGVLYHSVPATLAAALRELTWLPRVIKFTDDGDYIITDGHTACKRYL